MTDEAKKEVMAQIQAAERLRHQRAANVLTPWAEYICEQMSDRQARRARRLVVETLEVGDFLYRGQEPTIEVDFKRLRPGRKGCPNSTWSVSVSIKLGNKDQGSGFAIIGPRGAAHGRVSDYSLCGTSREF